MLSTTTCARGVTVVEGKGWYSKNEVNLLVVMARRHESQDIYNYIKKIDSNALVSQTTARVSSAKALTI